MTGTSWYPLLRLAGGLIPASCGGLILPEPSSGLAVHLGGQVSLTGPATIYWLSGRNSIGFETRAIKSLQGMTFRSNCSKNLAVSRAPPLTAKDGLASRG